MTERLLGPIVLLQVQRSPVKVPGGRYDPVALLPVGEAAVGPDGVVGLHGGAWVLDAHHAAHPARRGGAGRAVSLGFTGHYRLMEEHFGAALPGVGGENILVAAEGRIHPKDLLGTVFIRGAGGELALTGAQVAAPCLQFTSFLLGLDRVAERGEIADHLEFLGGGLRGFVLGAAPGTVAVVIRPGDEVWVRPPA
jgi:MOSC domain-containing protein YiiM